MKQQPQRVDTYILPPTRIDIAARIETGLLAIGKRVERITEQVAGVNCLVIRAYGRRPGEGAIAADVKRRAQ